MPFCFHLSLKIPAGVLEFTEEWPLLNTSDVIFLLLAYLAFVLKIGPVMMQTRRPLKMKPFLVGFNVIKIINCCYLTYSFYLYIYEKGLFPRSCNHDIITLGKIAALYWKYMITKLVDLLDTVFCVLRKKSSQITFLHVYHHVFMVLVTWMCLKYDPSDHWAFMALMNCSIHTVMYAYYGLAALGPAYAKYLWWKKYLTLMQLIQFVLVICHVLIQYYTSSCPIRTATYWVGLANLTLFICLFTDFYNKRYLAQQASEHAGSKQMVGFACVRQSND